MPLIWRMILTVYNLVILLLAGAVLCVVLGVNQPLAYLNAAFLTPENRIISGLVAAAAVVVALFGLSVGLSRKKTPESIIVDSNLSGQVSITVPAIEVIIMKAVKKVEGIKDIRPVVSSKPDGLMVYLHMMINPDRNVPQMSESIQSIVKEYIENIAGLQVAEIKILVDDFNTDKNAGKIRGH